MLLDLSFLLKKWSLFNVSQILIMVFLIVVIYALYSFCPRKSAFTKCRNIFKFFMFRDWLTTRITKIGIRCFTFYAFIKIYITLVSKDDPFHYAPHLLASLFEPLLASTVASFIFYLMFSGLQDRLQFKNDFILLFTEYKEMKYEIMRIMVLAQYNYCRPKNFDATVELLSQSPQKAQKYFSHEIFLKILNNLDELPTLHILRYMQSFLKTLESVNNRFVQKGIFDLSSAYQEIKDHEMKLESMLLGKQGKKLKVAPDWTEEFELKSLNVLYLLFCRKTPSETDPLFQIFEQAQKKYSFF